MPDIHRWQHQYLGASVFPKTLSAVELQAFFTFSEHELSELRKRFRSNARVAGAIQLGFLKMTGHPLEHTHVIPSTLLQHVSVQFGLPALSVASLKAMYTRPKTLYEHRWRVMEILGFSQPDQEQLGGLLPYLHEAARYAPSVDVLVEQAKIWLYQNRFVTPADRVIRDLARVAMAESEQELLQLIRSQLSTTAIRRIEADVLRLHATSGRSVLEWLQQSPRRSTNPALAERIERIDFLRGLGIDKLDLDAIAIEKMRLYANELQGIRPVKFRELKDPTRTLRLICFLKMALMRASDAAIMMGARLTSKIVRNAYEKARLLEAQGAVSRADAFELVIKRARDSSASDSEVRAYALELDETLKPRQFNTRAAAARWILSDPEQGKTLRSILSQMQKLGIEAEPHDPGKERIDYLSTLYQQKVTALPDKPGISIPTPWRDIIEGEDRERAMRGLEAATLIGLRKSLRSGAVYVTDSEKFRGRHRLMINADLWDKTKVNHYTRLSLPMRPEDFVESLVAELKIKLAALGAAVAEGRILIKDGRLQIPHNPDREVYPNVKLKLDGVFQKIGVVQLPDLILEMDSRVGVSKMLLGRLARSPAELLQVYGGMLAHGSALDASTVSLMVPQLSANQVLAGMQHFENRDAVRAANEAVMSFQRNLPIAKHWGDGSLVSADMMSLDVSRKIWLARLDPKRKVHSVGTYTHLADFWSVIYDQPIVLNERQAGAAIEGAIRQRELEVDQLAVDTHGYTEFAMAIAKLLGFALCPRLKRATERRFYVPSGLTGIPDALGGIVVPNISLRRVHQEWDDLVRLAASIESGHTTATVALARFGSAAADSPIYRAGVHLGRLVRSIYLCDYFLSEDLRRTVNRILVHGEGVHTLQRAICAGSFSKPRGQREEELYAVSGSLTLLTNLCLAWTATHMQEAIFGEDGRAADGTDLGWLAHASPAHYSNINFRGTFSFPVADYAQWLLADAPAQRQQR